jgi:hypothetical protein
VEAKQELRDLLQPEVRVAPLRPFDQVADRRGQAPADDRRPSPRRRGGATAAAGSSACGPSARYRFTQIPKIFRDTPQIRAKSWTSGPTP